MGARVPLLSQPPGWSLLPTRADGGSQPRAGVTGSSGDQRGPSEMLELHLATARSTSLPPGRGSSPAPAPPLPPAQSSGTQPLGSGPLPAPTAASGSASPVGASSRGAPSPSAPGALCRAVCLHPCLLRPIRTNALGCHGEPFPASSFRSHQARPSSSRPGRHSRCTVLAGFD